MPNLNKPRSASWRLPQQIDLFAAISVSGDIPAWSGLPPETKTALTGLMMQLMLDYANRQRIGTEDGHDL
jgi:hypothetical protein